MTKVSAPYLYRKRGIYYLEKRIPTDLVPHYGANSIQKSLRTQDRAQVEQLRPVFREQYMQYQSQFKEEGLFQ